MKIERGVEVSGVSILMDCSSHANGFEQLGELLPSIGGSSSSSRTLGECWLKFNSLCKSIVF